MKKTALTYATENIEWYKRHSVMNPYNKSTGVYSLEEVDKWNDSLRDLKIVTYLETILERLPYEMKES